MLQKFKVTRTTKYFQDRTLEFLKIQIIIMKQNQRKNIFNQSYLTNQWYLKAVNGIKRKCS